VTKFPSGYVVEAEQAPDGDIAFPIQESERPQNTFFSNKIMLEISKR
jgi:hypothetical protein